MAGGWRSLLGRGRTRSDDIGRHGTASQLALRLDRQLAKEERACVIFIAGVDDDRAGVDACAELALNLAEEYGRSVLMIDASFGAHGIGALLGDVDVPGLVDLLEGDSVDEAVLRARAQPTSNQLVSWLPSGQRRNGHIATASVKRLRVVIEAASGLADFILVQAPSVISGGRSLAFVALCDAALLVVLEGRTQVERIEQARDILLDCGASHVGLVLAG